MSKDSEMGFLEWLILSLVVLGFLGYGPCESCLHGCGPTLNKAMSDGGLKDTPDRTDSKR